MLTDSIYDTIKVIQYAIGYIYKGLHTKRSIRVLIVGVTHTKDSASFRPWLRCDEKMHGMVRLQNIYKK